MELQLLFKKWKFNHNYFSELLNMPKGTFNNKLSPSHITSFKNEELLELKKNLREMVKDVNSLLNTYLEAEEDFDDIIDEQIIYNGKIVKSS